VPEFLLRGPDNHSYMYQGDARPPRCDECGAVQDPRWIDPSFVLTNRTYDASYTYDGCLIVSERFRASIGGEAGVEVVELPENGYYQMVVGRTVRFDARRRGTRFENLCASCGFRDVAGATPVFLAEAVDTGVAATDVLFGSGDEQHPLVILAADAAARLRQACLNA
jgi:hypothetical protein